MLRGRILGAKETMSFTFWMHPERRDPSGENEECPQKKAWQVYTPLVRCILTSCSSEPKAGIEKLFENRSKMNEESP
jgi:hypothetical protein